MFFFPVLWQVVYGSPVLVPEGEPVQEKSAVSTFMGRRVGSGDMVSTSDDPYLTGNPFQSPKTPVNTKSKYFVPETGFQL